MFLQLTMIYMLCIGYGAAKKMPSSFLPISLGTTQATGNPWKQQHCRYEFTVPDKTGFCSGVSTGLDKKVDNVKQDMDQARLQIAKQNSDFLDQLHKLQLETINHATSVRDVQNELSKIKSTVNSFSTSGSTRKLEHELQNTRGQFNSAILDVKDKLLNMSFLLQADTVDQKKLYSNVLTQMNVQDNEMKNAAKKLVDLEKQVALIQPNSGGSAGVGKLGSDVLRLQSTVQNIKRDAIYSSQLRQQQFVGLEDKTNKLFLNLQNQSSELSNIHTTSLALYSRITNNEHLTATTNNELKDLKSKWDPRLGNVEKNVNDLNRHIATLKSELSNVASNLMNAKQVETKDKAAINDLNTSVNLLAHQLKDILVAVGNHTFSLMQVTNDLQSLKGSMSSVSPLASGLQTTINRLKQQTSQELKQEDTKLRNLQKTVSDMATKLKNLGTKTTPNTSTQASTSIHVPTLSQSTTRKVPTPKTGPTTPYPIPTIPHHHG